jgi:hypothetical protein
LSLTTSGFDSIRSVAESTLELLKTVPGLEDEETARGLRSAAENFLAEHGPEADKIEEPTVQEEVATVQKPQEEAVSASDEETTEHSTADGQ